MTRPYADGDQSVCLNCGEYVEYDNGNQPPWTHQDTGHADCAGEDTYAEPDPNYIHGTTT